jgi:CrcB protein
MTVVLVLLAGALGAVLRDVVARYVRRPLLGVAVVNVTGALALGVAVARVDGTALLVLGTGVLGGYTTYSTWMVEATVAGRRRGAANIVGQAALGIAAAATGAALAA